MPRVKRSYRSSLRPRQALATRSAILEGALGLFLEVGYVKTSIKAIAAAADVAPGTVYATFGDKPSILWAIADRATTGAENTSMDQSEVLKTIRSEPDPRVRSDLAIHWSLETHLRGIGDVEHIVEQAALVEPRLQELVEQMRAIRHRTSLLVVSAIMDGVELREGVSLEDLADAAEAIDSVPTFHRLTSIRGWTPEKYEAWMREILARVFLG